MEKGKLYVVATPIGNLEDVTFRAINILRSVAFILAEDTRESVKLLRRYEINTMLVSYRDQNHERMMNKILEKLDMGLDLALISDAGTPLISDPGFKLVRDLRNMNYVVESIPGPSALISALSIAGLPTDKFSFLGFLPKSDKKRKDILKKYLELRSTLVLYESPNRVLELLLSLESIDTQLNVVLAKDLTKLREEIFSGSPSDLIALLEAREFKDHPHGEFVVMISISE